MTETILAAQIEVGEHHTATWLGMTVNTDTVLSTAIAVDNTVSVLTVIPSQVAVWCSV